MASDAKACFPSKAEYRAVLRYLYSKGKRGKGIHGKLADVQVRFWVGNLNVVEEGL